jgi:hypothetical protein
MKGAGSLGCNTTREASHIPSYDMLHARWMPMWNSLLGTLRLSMVRRSIGLSIAMGEHRPRFAGQGARTGGMLSTDQKFASKETRVKLREWRQRLQAGPRNSGATAILEQGLSRRDFPRCHREERSDAAITWLPTLSDGRAALAMTAGWRAPAQHDRI